MTPERLEQPHVARAGRLDRRARPRRRTAAAAGQRRDHDAELHAAAGRLGRPSSTPPRPTAAAPGDGRGARPSPTRCRPAAWCCCATPAHRIRHPRTPRHEISPRQRRAAAPHLPARPARLRRPRPRRLPLRRLARGRRPDALADPAAGRHRPGQLALHEQLGLCRQRAADRPGRTAAAAAGSMRPTWRPAPGLRRAARELRRHGALPHGAAGAGRRALRRAARHAEQRADFAAFCAAQRRWLDDYALFMALCEANDWRDWCDWAPALAAREPAALAAARAAARRAHRTSGSSASGASSASGWRCKAYANDRGVEIVGDAPIFIAHQSAEVWAQPEAVRAGRATAGPRWWPACRPTSSAPPASAGATRCTAGARTPRTATPGGWSACAAPSSWWTSCASTTSAALPATGRSRPASPRPSRAAGCRARASRCSRPSPRRWGRCPSSPRTWA